VQPVSEAVAARAVLDSLLAWGQVGRNAVMDVLDGTDRPRCGEHYPREALAFGDGRWRAYYHSHPEGLPAPAEHGHFHLFVEAPATVERDRPWAHVAALSIDPWGQPVRWFTVNAWVTDDAWAPVGPLLAALDALQPEAEGATLASWLAGMLHLYRPELASLLAGRATRLGGEGAAAARLDDRTLYLLDEIPIDLQSRLAELLAAAPDQELQRRHEP